MKHGLQSSIIVTEMYQGKLRGIHSRFNLEEKIPQSVCTAVE